MLVTVKCKKCDWKKQRQDPLDWWKKPCPKCKAKNIVDKKDMDNYLKPQETSELSSMSAITDDDGNMLEVKLTIHEDDLTSENSFTCFKCGNNFPNALLSKDIKNCCFMCAMGIENHKD